MVWFDVVSYGDPWEALHSRHSDVFQFGKVIWEAFTNNFGGYLKHFTEGRGLKSHDLHQVTLRQRKKANIHGLKEFHFLVVDGDISPLEGDVTEQRASPAPTAPKSPTSPLLPTRRLSILSEHNAFMHLQLAQLCAHCLQHQQAWRTRNYLICYNLLFILIQKNLLG